MKPIITILIAFFSINHSFAQSKIYYNITEYGAVTGANCTVAIQKAVDECHENGGGVVQVPPGVFETGTIFLRSDVHLHLSSGAELKGSSGMEGFLHDGNKHGILIAENCRNITISGTGVINANGTVFFDKTKRHDSRDYIRALTRQGESYLSDKTGQPDGPISYEQRPGMTIVFKSCENIVISDITIKDTPEWALRIGESDNVLVTGIKIFNNLLVPNSDGIHCTTSRNVRISDCDLRCGDDAIIVTGFNNSIDVSGKDEPSEILAEVIGNKYKVSENITVTNCVMQSMSAGIRVGYGVNPIRNCVFSNLVIYNSNRGIGIFARDNASIENIYFSNIVIQNTIHSGWWGHGEPIHVSSIPQGQDVPAGVIRNVTFSDITATSETGIVVYGYEEGKITDLTFDRVKLKIVKGEQTNDFGGNFDLRPVADKKFGIFKHDIPGLYAQNVSGLTVENFKLDWEAGLPEFFTHGIQCEKVNGLKIDRFSGKGAAQEFSAIDLKKIDKVSIMHSEATKGCGVFISYDEIQNAGYFINNDLREATNVSEQDLKGFMAKDNLIAK